MTACIKKAEQYRPCQKIFDILYQKEMAVFLDSSKKNKLGMYSIIGIHPYLILKEEDGVLYVNGKKEDSSLEAYLKKYLKENKEENITALPLLSGGIGYFSYDYGRKFEKAVTKNKKYLELPEAMIVFYDNYIIEDIEKKEVYLVANGKLKEQKCSIKELEMLLLKLENEKKEDNVKKEREKSVSIEQKSKQKEKMPDSRIIKNFTKKQYLKAIEQVKSYIQKGHIYVMNMTQQIKIKSRKSPYVVFKNLQKNNAAPFAVYMNAKAFEIISASPERFIKVKNGVIETRPIKGTRKRGSYPKEDEWLKQELKNSEKDKSELLMIVDLERNDLNRICIFGSVQVTELFQIETYATVFHLVANVIGTLREEIDVVDILKAVFPGGSITGAPKIRAMEIIDELENQCRGIYTGIIGYLSLNGDCEFNIAIRTAIHQGEDYYIGAGGGITYESDTEFEYEETLQKAKALVEAIL